MTTKQLENFNRAVTILYEREYYHTTLTSLAIKYGITSQQAGQILNDSRSNRKILNAVEVMKKHMDELNKI